MVIVLFFEADALGLTCGNVSHSGRRFEEQQYFHDELKGYVMCLGDINGHMGMNVDWFYWAHGGYGIG